MPGWYLHLDIARKAILDLEKRVNGDPDASDPQAFQILLTNGTSASEIVRIAKSQPAHFALGAIGPDLFFFLPDFQPPAGTLLYGASHAVKTLYDKLDPLIAPIVDKYTEIVTPIEDFINAETGGLTSQLASSAALLSQSLTEGLELIAANSYDIWGLLGSGVPRGYDEQVFYWSDMFHYRKTYEFAAHLWTKAGQAQASQIDGFRAFALGWMTHLAADVAGHAFTNEKCGGPYRLHWQRHHLVENHMDGAVYVQDEGTLHTNSQNQPNYQEICTSAMHLWLAFDDPDPSQPKRNCSLFDDNSRPEYLTGIKSADNADRKDKWDVDSDMPQELAQFLANAIRDVYSTPGDPIQGSWASHPTILNALNVGNPDGFPSATDIVDTYFYVYKYVKFTTTDYFKFTPPEVPRLYTLPNITFPSFPQTSNPPAPAGQSSLSTALELLVDILKWMAFCIEVILWAAAEVIAIANGVATLGLRWFIYLYIELPLYNLEMAFHHYLSLLAFTYPLKQEIAPWLTTLGVGMDDVWVAIEAYLLDPRGGLDLSLSGTESSGFDPAHARPIDAMTDPAPFVSSKLPYVTPNKPCSDLTEAPSEFFRPFQWPDFDRTQDPIGSEAPLIAAPSPYVAGQDANALLGGQIGDMAVRASLEGAANEAATNTTVATAFAQAGRPNLGDPKQYATYVIARLTRDSQTGPIRNFNLDADRGYGYLCWDWVRSHAIQGIPSHFNDFSIATVGFPSPSHFYQVPLSPGYGWCDQEIPPQTPPPKPQMHLPELDATNGNVLIRYIDREDK